MSGLLLGLLKTMSQSRKGLMFSLPLIWRNIKSVSENYGGLDTTWGTFLRFWNMLLVKTLMKEFKMGCALNVHIRSASYSYIVQPKRQATPADPSHGQATV